MIPRFATLAFVVLSFASVVCAALAEFAGLPLQPLGPPAGAVMLILASIAACGWIASACGWPRTLAACVGVLAICTGAEWSGLVTGIPFGQYRYTLLWWPASRLPSGHLFPWLLPLAWLVLIVASFLSSSRRSLLSTVVETALLCTLVDAALEPVLTGPVGFWHWAAPTPLLVAPYSNAAGWFVVSACCALVLRGASQIRDEPAKTPRAVLLGILVCNLAIGATYREPRAILSLVPMLWLAWPAMTKNRRARTVAEACDIA